ncbi:uracil-DNA glycosylase [Candidatus Kaiserbacteria bacterium]|nr:uracil-DNA glycosylase [Candidatus Kaiserbacteria bacterium]
MNVKIEASWQNILADEFEKEYFLDLTNFVKKAYLHKVIYPKPANLFAAFNLCPFDKVKVVILGQDPYHGQGQATGLSFSVPETVGIPPSLKNIFKEIQNDIGQSNLKNGDLSHWAEQGVLLLNSTLTVEAHKAGSHKGKGWEEFTDSVISKLSDQKENLVFLLWGNYAKQKGSHIDRNKHLVLESSHPSPLSAHTGWFGNHHFSQTNNYLKKHNLVPIEW